MRILVVAHYQGDGSPSAIFIHDQVKAYVQAGHEVLVFSPVGLGKKDLQGSRLFPLVRKQTIDGIEHVYMRYLTLSRYGNRHFNHTSAIAVLKTSFHKVLGQFDPDVIHAHTLGFNSEIGAYLKEKLGAPLVVTTHGSDTFIPHMEGQCAELKEYADKADTVVCVSSLLRQRLTECGVSVPMQVILNGFNIRYVTQPQKKDPTHMMQVGSLIPRKKTDMTIRAAAMLKEQTEKVRLTVIGSGPERENLENLAAELHVENDVLFAGQLSNQEVQERMAEATYFVMPSVREGFGIVYLEAMAAGCIVIGTEGEGIADAITHAGNGFLVPADNAEAIVQVIRNCMDDPVRAAQIAENGRNTALALTWPHNAEQYQELFETLTKGEKAE